MSEEEKKNRYENSKVYKLIDDKGYYYYGSTCLPLCKRFYQHKSFAKTESTRKIYTVFTYERFVNGELRIVLEKDFKLNSREELLREENVYIERSAKDPMCLNSISAIKNFEKMKEYITNYKNTHAEELKQYNKQYNLDHKEEKKQYRENHKNELREYFKQYKAENKDIIKKYREEHRDHISEYMKQYRLDNHEKILLKDNERYITRRESVLKRMAEKYTCECGRTVSVGNKSKHEKMKVHINYMEVKMKLNDI